MDPLTARELRGVWATMLLPVRADESIDEDVLAAALEHVLASGVPTARRASSTRSRRPSATAGTSASHGPRRG